jgi:hypothetical protein
MAMLTLRRRRRGGPVVTGPIDLSVGDLLDHPALRAAMSGPPDGGDRDPEVSTRRRRHRTFLGRRRRRIATGSIDLSVGNLLDHPALQAAMSASTAEGDGVAVPTRPLRWRTIFGRRGQRPAVTGAADPSPLRSTDAAIGNRIDHPEVRAAMTVDDDPGVADELSVLLELPSNDAAVDPADADPVASADPDACTDPDLSLAG